MKRLAATLREQQAEAAKLDAAIAANLKELGYGGEWTSATSRESSLDASLTSLARSRSDGENVATR